MISHPYRCIFIHIPKTAGTSIEYKLGHFKELKRGVQDHSTVRDLEPLSLLQTVPLLLKGELKWLYRRARYSMNGRSRVSPQQFRSYFKFTFVRNSWSRVFSWYKNVMRDQAHRHTLGVSDHCSFDEFLKRHLRHWLIQSQLYWIRDFKEGIPLDFIGRYETLERDFAHVCEVLGLKGDPTLPHLLPGNNEYYAPFYNEPMKDIVAKAYADEIKLFQFEFGQ